MLLFIGIACVVTLLLLADYKSVMEGVCSIGYRNICILCILQIITIGLINIQWMKISKDIGLNMRFIDALDMNMRGTFFESITPAAKAGGEFAKVMFLRSKLGFSLGEASAVVSFQKILSMVCFLGLSFVSLICFLVIVPLSWEYRSLLLSSFLFVSLLVSVIILSLVFREKLDKFIYLIPVLKKHEFKIKDFLYNFDECIKKLIRNKNSFIFHIVIGIIIWTLFAVKTYYIVLVLGSSIKFSAAAAITYLTYMVGMLPLLPGGLGSFEGSMIILLSSVGISSSVGMVIAIVLRFVTFWFVFLLSGIYLGTKLIIQRRKEEALV
ncbi:hypothetical protein CLOTH_10020 [Alkalithermobacter paradoxus]|uniref:Phosphatidylglycerol lysyltransferase n=1 Tax=Alkalithermobacter paradoxus TaxID=29349 RepID=A0A1V4I7F3_9FIRM|nr:hypothetical protein CLOTH_10020 [[Clostridium] thermoalcaliphilum]